MTPDVKEYRRQCRAFAELLEYRAYSGIAAVVAASTFSLSTLYSTGAKFTAFMFLPIVIHCVAGAMTVGISLLLYFDAHLFRRMATHTDEISGGAAIDDYLARQRLRRKPDRVRPLADRIAGSRLWMRRQLVMAGIAAGSGLLALALHFA